MTENKRLTIGILFDIYDKGYNSNLWNNIADIAEEMDVNIYFIIGRSLSSPYEYDKEHHIIYNLINKKNLDGLIILPGVIGSYISIEELTEFFNRFKPIPMVSISLVMENIPSIMIDNSIGFIEVLEHLITYHGYKKIAYIRGTQGHQEAEIRFQIYKDILAKHKINFNPDLVAQGNFYYNSGAESVKLLLNEKKMKFEVLVSANDEMALGAFKVLQEYNINVPRDIALVGFDDIAIAQHLQPPLTTVSQFLKKQARKALEILIEQINGKKVPAITCLPTKAIIRQSCGCFSPALINLDSIINRNNLTSLNSEYGHKLDRTVIYTEIKKILDDIDINSDILNLWIENLIDSTIKTLRTKDRSDREYLYIVSEAPITKISIDSMNYFWKNLLMNIHDIFIKYLNDNSMIAYYELLFRKASILIDEILLRSDPFHFINEKIMIWTIMKVSNVFGLNELMDEIANNLAFLGNNKCYISTYDSNPEKQSDFIWKIPEKSKLILAFSKTGKNVLVNENVYFPTFDLLPENFIPNERFSMILMPLFSRTEHFGFILFELGSGKEPIYEILRANISNSIKNVFDQKALKRSNEIEQISRQKTDAFINISHEIKTPLTLISNYLDKHVKKYKNTEELDIVIQNVNKLKRDINNVLDFEKLEKGMLYYDHSQIADLSNILEMNICQFKEIADRKGIDLRCNVESNIYTKIDPRSIDRITNNLIDNAIKFTEASGKIDIELKINNNDIELIISDTGIGIPEEMQKHIFEQYYQVSHKKSNIQGIGMGLNIVKRIVDEVSGQILIYSKQGEGASFKILLKRYFPQENDRIQTISDNGKIIFCESGNIKIKENKYDKDKKTILIVEDNPQMLSYLQNEMLEKYNIYYALNGKEALEKIKNISKPDIIISDIMMDIMDGYEFYDELINTDIYKAIPFIFLSAKGSEEDRINGLKKGAIDYITKPFNIEELLAKISSLLQLKEALKKERLEEIIRKLYWLLDSNINLTDKELTLKKNNAVVDQKELYMKYGISRRQIEIISLLEKGFERKEISDSLNISLGTVKTHIERLYKKFEVNNKIDLLNIVKN